MSEKPISPLRQRMIEDATARNFIEKADARGFLTSAAADSAAGSAL